MFRSRDIIAVLLAAWLVRLANRQEKTISAALHLAFYTHASVFSPFDVDGDGTVEALAIISGASSIESDTPVMLEILDLKPLHSNKLVDTAPFRPKTMLAAIIPPVEGTKARPLKISTGQIFLRHNGPKKKTVTSKVSDTKYTDRTRHYFCGTDWHDASLKCSTPCPGGTPGECPDDLKCYADTPCDALAETKEKFDTEYQLTPAGSLPSVASLWADGTVRLHSVTSTHNQELELKEMWSQKITLGFDYYDVLVLGDQDFSDSSTDGKFGIVLVGGLLQPASVVHALDAFTGKILWTSETPVQDDVDEAHPRGLLSSARRRSRLLEGGQSAKQDTPFPNCWSSYRHSLLAQGIESFWALGDGKWQAVHLDRQRHKKKKKKHGRKWHQRHARPIVGRPNALMLRHRGGIQVRSLKNGRALCHLTLLDRVVYGDLNQDGILDQIQPVTSEQTNPENSKWVQALSQEVGSESPQGKVKSNTNRLCHLLALSGLPAREKIFSVNICPGDTAEDNLSAIAPLLTATNHVVVALSNGLVSKHNVQNGLRVWQHYGHESSPTWHASSNAAMMQSLYPTDPESPILVVGENGMTLLATRSGKTLTTTTFPQATSTRPVMEDWSGDGTPDILIATPDAVWGYRILVNSHGTSSRILVGLLLVAMALALLRNRFGGGNGKRSTDK